MGTYVLLTFGAGAGGYWTGPLVSAPHDIYAASKVKTFNHLSIDVFVIILYRIRR
jgi:hypothetical protein